MKLAIRIAMTYLYRRNSYLPSFTAIVSVLGVAFGVAAFLVVITVLNSFEHELQSALLAANPHMIVYNFPNGIPEPRKFETQLKSWIKRPVTGTSLFQYSEAILTKEKHSAAVIIKGIEGENSAGAEDLKRLIKPIGALASMSPASDQRKLTPTTLPGIILGKNLALKLEANQGDIVNLVVSQADSAIYRFRMVGTINVGLSQYDERLAFTDFTAAQKIFSTPNTAHGVEIRFKDPNDALAESKDLDSKISYAIRPWQEIDKGLFETIERDGSSIKGIVLVITFVAAFNIIATLSLSVVDRRRQIALLRSLGATRSFIMTVFVANGLVLGFFGAIVGVALGAIILKIFSNYDIGELQSFYFLSKIPVNFDIKLMGGAILVAVVLSFVSSLYPAWKATRVSPLFGLKPGN